MDPKQTSPLGGNPVGGQEGQNPSSASVGANSGATPVFSSGTDATPTGASATDQKMPGTLGAENLSTGANVARTMDSLNSKNQSATGTSVFSKHKFDRAEPDGAILIPESKGLFFKKSKNKQDDLTGSMIAARGETTDGLDPETRRKRKMMRIGGIIGGFLAAVLAIVIVVVLVAAPRPEKPKAATAPSITELSQAFDRYANYILYGETSTELISGDISIANNYELNKKIGNIKSEESKQFFAEAKANFDSFMNTYNSSNIAEDSYYLNWFVPYYKQVFDFVYGYSQVGRLDTEELLPIFVTNGVSGMDTFFDQNYKKFKESELDNSKDFYEAQKQILEYQKQYFALARQNGCIQNTKIADGCKVSISNEELTKYSDANKLSSSRIGLSVDELISSISHMQTEILQPVKEAQEVEVVIDENGIKPEDIKIEIVEENKGDA